MVLLLAITLPPLTSCNAAAQEMEPAREPQKDRRMINAPTHATVMTPTTPPTVTIVVIPRPFSDNTERDNAHLIYPFGDAWDSLFEHATWLFTNGSFIFRPAGAKFPRLGQVLLSGSYTVEHGSYELHGEVRTPWETTSSLDGWLVPIEGGYRLDALHVVTYGGYSQVERIMQELRQAPATAEIVMSTLHLLETQGAWVMQARQQTPATAAAEIEALLQELEQAPATAKGEETGGARAGEPGRALTEQQTYVEGIPLLTGYDVRLQGSVDGMNFGPVEGLLQIGSLKGEDNTRFGVLLATEAMDRPGAMVWSNERSVRTAADALQTEIIGTLEIRDSKVTVEISDEDPSGASSWRTTDATGPHAADETPFVAMSRGRLTFMIAEEIRGEVQGDGMRLPMLRMPSSYRATFAGHRRVSKIVQAQQTATGLYRFDGSWLTKDSVRDPLRLMQKEDKITGTYPDGGRLEGTAHEDRMSFTLYRGELPAERGFLRALRGGQYLVGYIGQPREGVGLQPLIAIRDQPPLAAQMVTKDDIYAARILAGDLVSVGKCRQVLDVLGPIFQSYEQASTTAQKQKTPGLRFWEQEEYLIQLSAAVHPLITCAFELGEYKDLIRYLRQALQVASALGLAHDMLRLLTDRIQKSKEAASRQNETFTLLRQNVVMLQRMVDLGGIGIAFEARDPGGQPTVIGVTPGRPAAAAGMAMGDVLVAIDGEALSGLGTYEVAERLLGPVGSRVQVTIRRGERVLELAMARTLSGQLSPKRRGEVTQALEQEVADLAQTQAILASMPDAKAITDVTNGPQALRRLQDAFAAHADQLLAIQRATLARVHRLYSDYPDILGPVDRVFDSIERARVNPDQMDVAAARAAEEAENTVKELIGQNPSLSDIEQNLLWQQMYIVSTLTQVAFHFSVEAHFIKRLKVEDRYAARATRTQEAANSLGKWLEQWRQRLQTDQAKIAALETGQEFFDEAVRLYLELGLPAEALVMAEAGRARAFADLVAARAAPNRQGATPVVQDVMLSKDAIVSEVHAPPLTLTDLQETVKASESTAVEYYVLADRVLIWVIAPTGTIQMRSAPVARTTLEHDIERFVELIERRPAPDQQDTTAMAQAQKQAEAELRPLLERFYTLLIAPIKALLPRSADAVVTIVPHGRLFRLPFAAFKTSQEGKDHFLVEDHTLVYAPSLGILQHIPPTPRGHLCRLAPDGPPIWRHGGRGARGGSPRAEAAPIPAAPGRSSRRELACAPGLSIARRVVNKKRGDDGHRSGVVGVVSVSEKVASGSR
jgi:CHAT domain-containing protein